MKTNDQPANLDAPIRLRETYKAEAIADRAGQLEEKKGSKSCQPFEKCSTPTSGSGVVITGHNTLGMMYICVHLSVKATAA